MVDSQKIPILILGASGRLGSLVTKHALKQPNLSVNIILRDLEKSKDLANEVKTAGGKVIQGDINKPETIQDCTKGIHTVISCITIASEQDTRAQSNVLNDAVKNGVKRFFSSHFGINYDHAVPGNVLIDSKLKAKEEIKKTNIKPVIITTGLLLDFILGYNSQGLRYFGDINQKLDLTSYDDVARFVVAIAADPEKSGSFTIVGEELSTKEIVDIYNRVRGTNIQAHNAGTVDDLRQATQQKKKEGDQLSAAFTNVFELVYGGKGKISKTDNKDFPQVKTTSLEEFLKQNPDVNIAA